MTVRGVIFDCDTPDCGAYCQIDAYDVGYAAQRAAERFGWSSDERGHDYCGPCTQNAAARAQDPLAHPRDPS